MSDAVILICDKNFFLSSLGAAISARKYIVRTDIRVIIFVTDADPSWLSNIVPVAKLDDVEVQPAHIPEIDAMHNLHRDRYLPAVALARLWLHRLLPDDIERFLYIDGDVLVEDNLDALFESEQSSSKLLVASDTVALCNNEWGRSADREMRYLAELEVAPSDYFNSGVILASRRVWEEIAGSAIEYLAKYPERCRSSDQSALNAVARGRTARLSQRWNYQSDHMMLLDPRRLGFRPGIWHFTGGPKPWQGTEWPWDASFTWAYGAAQRSLRGLNLEDPKPSPKQLASGLTHRARAKWRYKWIYPSRRTSRAAKIAGDLAAGIGS